MGSTIIFSSWNATILFENANKADKKSVKVADLDMVCSVPDPPYNICVAHEESIVLPSAAYATKTVAHYHPAPSCIWIKDPTFTPHALVISSSIASKLIDSNKSYLHQFFGIQLS